MTLILLAVLFITIFMGTPIAFGLGFSAVVLILVFLDYNQLLQIGSIAFSQSTSINQLVAPLFILMAETLSLGNIARDLFYVLNKWLQRCLGGLALTTMIASTVFAALCGSSPATVAVIGRVSIIEMITRGYRQDFASGLVAAGGTLGIMIPPSITLVIYGIITENSIAKLFMAGIFPGILISLLLSCFVMVRIFLNPELIRKENNVFDLLPGIDKEEKNSENARSILNDFYIVSPPLILIILVLGSLYFGVATPTEAAGIGAVGALLMVMMRGRLTLTRLEAILGATAKNSVMILFLIIGGMTLSYVVSYMGLARELSALIVNAGLDRWTIMILIYILWLVLGCLMDPLSMIVLTIPFIYPTILELGFDPLWLGIVSTLCVEIGMITPPIGLNLFVLKAITDVPMAEIMLGAFPFVLVLIVGLVILSLFPKICLILPSTM